MPFLSIFRISPFIKSERNIWSALITVNSPKQLIPIFIPSSNNFYTSSPDIFIRAPSAEV